MVGHLQVIAGPDLGRSFALEDGQTLVIGRGEHTATRLKDLRVSRVHCELRVGDGLLRLVDLGGAGGILVNGRTVAERDLRPGDVIQVGETQLKFVPAGPHEQDTCVPDPQTPRVQATAAELQGRKVAHFEVGPVLARGRTGTVYRARDVRDGRPVAFKVLDPRFAEGETQVRRFVRAMKTVVGLDHPNIVSLYGAGKAGTTCWMAMEYVEGESLAGVIRRIGTAGMLDWRYALTVAVHIARALEAAHERRIIHRNVAPENILIRRSDDAAKLGDLMLAKALDGALARQVTRPGELVGDLAYMAPERTREDGTIDTRSDLYGLGATVYALLTGRPPFEAASPSEKVRLIRTAEPVKPKRYQLGVPDLFQDAVLKLLAKRREDRFQTPGDLARDLVRIARFQGMTL